MSAKDPNISFIGKRQNTYNEKAKAAIQLRNTVSSEHLYKSVYSRGAHLYNTDIYIKTRFLATHFNPFILILW